MIANQSILKLSMFICSMIPLLQSRRGLLLDTPFIAFGCINFTSELSQRILARLAFLTSSSCPSENPLAELSREKKYLSPFFNLFIWNTLDCQLVNS